MNCSSVSFGFRSSSGVLADPRVHLGLERRPGTAGARRPCSGSRSPDGSRRRRRAGTRRTPRAAASTRRAAPRRRGRTPSAPARDSSSSVFEVDLDVGAHVPSALTKPPCAVPVWTLILLRPTRLAPRSFSFRLKPFMYACSSCTSEFLPPTSPISPPTDTVTPFGSCCRMNAAKSAASVTLTSCCSSSVGLLEVDQRRGVDVDVVEPGGDLLPDERPQRVELLVALGAVELLGVGLDVVALDEDRAAEALAQRRGQHDRGVLVRALLGVADLGARDLEDERAGLERLRRPDDGARRVVGHRADVDRRHGEAAGLAAAHRHVQIVNRRGPDARRRRQRSDHPAGRAADLGVGAERRRPRELVDSSPVTAADWSR